MYCPHAAKEAVEKAAGIAGKPMLQVGGEQEAVTDPAPGDRVETAQDSMHPAPAAMTPGCDEVQVRGTLLRTIPLFVLGRELFPIASVIVAMTVSAVPLVTAKSVCCDPARPNSSATFWIGHVSKKSKTTGGEGTRFGCRKELLETPLAEA